MLSHYGFSLLNQIKCLQTLMVIRIIVFKFAILSYLVSQGVDALA